MAQYKKKVENARVHGKIFKILAILAIMANIEVILLEEDFMPK